MQDNASIHTAFAHPEALSAHERAEILGKRPVPAKLLNDLRDAERYWQGYAVWDHPTMDNPYSKLKAAYEAKIIALRAEIASYGGTQLGCGK